MPDEILENASAAPVGADLVGDPAAPAVVAEEPKEDAPSDIDWKTAGPKLWAALKNILGGNKTKHDDKYVIEASHEDVQSAHDALDV